MAVRDEIAPLLADLHKFVDRRIAELSVEVNGAVQMVDFSESSITGQIIRMQEEIANMIAVPTNTTRNSGLELEAVVQATEVAANRIMEAAESISDWISDGGDVAKLSTINDRVNAIFVACTFQDLTGQRIRRAIQHLQSVETMLSGLAPGASRAAPEEEMPDWGGGTGPDLAQDDIDKLLA